MVFEIFKPYQITCHQNKIKTNCNSNKASDLHVMKALKMLRISQMISQHFLMLFQLFDLNLILSLSLLKINIFPTPNKKLSHSPLNHPEKLFYRHIV